MHVNAPCHHQHPYAAKCWEKEAHASTSYTSSTNVMMMRGCMHATLFIKYGEGKYGCTNPLAIIMNK
jgi:hypothetical protein